MLTEATRNPTLEDQALARVHRMGQKREVTTVRFVVRGTFEKVLLLACFPRPHSGLHSLFYQEALHCAKYSG